MVQTVYTSVIVCMQNHVTKNRGDVNVYLDTKENYVIKVLYM